MSVPPIFHSLLCRFKVDAFLWNWQNASGKAETNIILIRFFLVASYGLRAASRSGGFDISERSQELAMNEKSEKAQRSKSADMILMDTSKEEIYDA